MRGDEIIQGEFAVRNRAGLAQNPWELQGMFLEERPTKETEL